MITIVTDGKVVIEINQSIIMVNKIAHTVCTKCYALSNDVLLVETFNAGAVLKRSEWLCSKCR